MDLFFFISTIILIFICIFPVIRFLAVKCNIIPNEGTYHDRVPNIQSAAHDPSSENPVGGTHEVVVHRSRFSGSLSALATSFLGLAFLYFILSGKLSLDLVYTGTSSSKSMEKQVASGNSGIDWKVVDGVRWFRVIGTDSAGISYSGWISELFFRREPPDSNPESKDFMEKIGLPSMKERLEGAKQMRNIGKTLQKVLSSD